MKNASEILSELATLRQRAVERILASPENFKVCEGCLSVLVRNEEARGVCPICGAYLFDANVERVKRQATELGERPMGLMVPYLPRFPLKEIP